MDSTFTEGMTRIMEESILAELFEARENTVLEENLRKDSGYQEKKNKISRCISKLENIEFTSKQWEVVDVALSSCNERDSEYARVAYCLGFQDGVKFLIEVMEI